LKDNQEVMIEITPKTNVLKEFFGSAKEPIDTEKVLQDLRQNESKHF